LGNKDAIDHLYKEKGWPPETNVWAILVNCAYYNNYTVYPS
jgi:hypothetical protein